MRNQQQCYFFLVQIMLQPFYHFNIQVVGRFIHYQQHMLVLKTDINQCFGKCHAFALAAAEVYLLVVSDEYSVCPISVLLWLSKSHAPSSSIFTMASPMLICIVCFTGRFIFFYGIDDRVVMMENIIQHCFVFIKLWVLFK